MGSERDDVARRLARAAIENRPTQPLCNMNAGEEMEAESQMQDRLLDAGLADLLAENERFRHKAEQYAEMLQDKYGGMMTPLNDAVEAANKAKERAETAERERDKAQKHERRAQALAIRFKERLRELEEAARRLVERYRTSARCAQLVSEMDNLIALLDREPSDD